MTTTTAAPFRVYDPNRGTRIYVHPVAAVVRMTTLPVVPTTTVR